MLTAPTAPDPKPDPLTQLTVQLALLSVVDDKLSFNITRPNVDGDFIDNIVGSRARHKLRLVINHHRELWNSQFIGVIEQLRREQSFARTHLPVMRFQARFYRIAFYTTRTWAWFVRWPSWAKWYFLLLNAIGWWMTIASGVGVYKLLSNTAILADSPVACAVIASLVGGSIYGIKGGIASIESDLWRRRFRKGLAALTALLAVAFFVLLSLLTGGLGAGMLNALQMVQASPVESLSWLSPHVQYVQMILESASGLATFLFADFYCEKHGPPNREQSPKKRLRHQQWAAAIEAYQKTHNAVGRARGLRRQLLADRKRFVSQATSVYERKADLYRRQEDGIRRQRGEAAAEAPRGFFSRVRGIFPN